MVGIRVLGGLAVEVDGRPVELPADARAQELLGWLVVHPGMHARSELAGRLRPDVAEESARKTLRDAVYELRRALGDAGRDAVVATREQVGLDAGRARADLWDFRRAVAEGDPAAALEAGRGALLAGFAADWVLRARDEHTAERAALLAALTAAAEARGELAEAVARARERVDVEPLSEEAHRELVRLLARSGDRPAALAAAAALTERLRRELGVPPSSATRALVEDVRRGRVTASGEPEAPAPLPGALARAREPHGREEALARLEQAWRDALAGAPQVALVTGEPGIGKTTLAAAFARRAHAAGARVLLGRSDERTLIPYQPWVEALEQLLAALAGGLQPPGPRERYLAFELVRALLERQAARQPLLIVLDDVQWADSDSAELLAHLGRGLAATRLLVLATARRDELAPAVAAAVAEVRRAGMLVPVALQGLDEPAIARLLGERAADAAEYRRRTGGNPFFLHELLREERDARAPGLPAGVQEVVGRRLERLSPAAREVLAHAAAAGLESDPAVLRAATRKEPAELLEALGEAERAGLLTAAGAGRVAFAHALVAETVTAGLAAGASAAVHLRLAEVLEAQAAAPAEVAAHLRAAGLLAAPERLAAAELAAARAAGAALAHADAAQHYERALAAAPAPAEERGELLLALGHAHDRAGSREDARAAFTQAAELARGLDDPALLARAALGFGGLAVVVAAPDPRLMRLLEEALASADAGDRLTRARLRARLAIERYYDDPGESLVLSEAALEDARAAADPGVLAAALNARRVALWAPGHVRERLTVVDEMVAAAAAAGDREAELQARNWRVVDLWELGRIDAMRAEVRAYEELAEAVALPHYLWYVALWRGGLAVMEGRWAAAAELRRRAAELGARADDPNAAMLTRAQEDMVLHLQRRNGDVDRSWYERMAAASPAPSAWRCVLVHLDAALGRPEAARPALHELLGGARAPDVNWLEACVLAMAAADLDDREAAATLHARLEPYADLFSLIARGAATYGSTQLYLGRLALVLDRPEEAEGRLRRAVERNAQAGARPLVAEARRRLAQALATRGDLPGAAAELEAARHLANELELTGMLAELAQM